MFSKIKSSKNNNTQNYNMLKNQVNENKTSSFSRENKTSSNFEKQTNNIDKVSKDLQDKMVSINVANQQKEDFKAAHERAKGNKNPLEGLIIEIKNSVFSLHTIANDILNELKKHTKVLDNNLSNMGSSGSIERCFSCFSG